MYSCLCLHLYHYTNSNRFKNHFIAQMKLNRHCLLSYECFTLFSLVTFKVFYIVQDVHPVNTFKVLVTLYIYYVHVMIDFNFVHDKEKIKIVIKVLSFMCSISCIIEDNTCLFLYVYLLLLQEYIYA